MGEEKEDGIVFFCIGSCRETSEVSADQLHPLLSVEFSIKYHAAFFSLWSNLSVLYSISISIFGCPTLVLFG